MIFIDKLWSVDEIECDLLYDRHNKRIAKLQRKNILKP